MIEIEAKLREPELKKWYVVDVGDDDDWITSNKTDIFFHWWKGDWVRVLYSISTNDQTKKKKNVDV